MGNQRSKDTSKLSEKEISLMLLKTDFTRDQVLEWHENFMNQHPDGCLDYEEFFELYRGVINPNDPSGRYSRILFDAFDVDKNGKISLREFLILTVFQLNKETDGGDELSLDQVDDKSFELALSLWYSNGNFSQEELEKVQLALAEAQNRDPDGDAHYPNDENVDKFRRIVESCKTIISS